MSARRDPRIAGIVLAGGRSVRFGADKRAALLDGEPLLVRAMRGVAAVAREVVVVVGPDDVAPEPPSGLTVPVRVAHDRIAGAGPLAGLLAGLEAAASDVVLVVGGDMPWLDARVLRLMARAAARPGPDAWILEGPDALAQTLPLAGRRVPLLAATRVLLGMGERSLRGLLTGAGAGRIKATSWRRLDPDGRTIRDIDRPDDLPSVD